MTAPPAAPDTAAAPNSAAAPASAAAPSPAAAPQSPNLPGDVPRPPRSLYIHIPFCVSICPYCDFVVVAGAASRGPRNRIAAFVAALHREIELRSPVPDPPRPPGLLAPGSLKRDSYYSEGHHAGGDAAAAGSSYYSEGHQPAEASPRPPIETLYFGGGTPTLLPTADIAGLIELVRAGFGLAGDAEITIEANPGPDERGDAGALRDAGVTRISFGAQALDDLSLRNLGRRHRAEDVEVAVREARAAGITSVNIDLLYDTPGQTVERFAATLDAAIALEPDHLSLYALTLDDPDAEGLTGTTGDHLPLTRGARAWRSRARAAQDEDRAAAMYEHAVKRLAAAGFDGYEISNWARSGHESRHNLGYWERRPHEAVGPGAHAFDGTTRRWNAARLDRYIAALTPLDGSPSSLPPGGADEIGAAEAAAERVILGLRLAQGIPAEVANRPPLGDHLEWAMRAGLLNPVPGERLALTTRGRLLSNELFSRLV